MIEAPARCRLDVCCNDPDNGLFSGRAAALNLSTWDGELIEIEAADMSGPRFSEKPGAIRICRRDWPILASKDWYGNWCWNAYWLSPDVLVDLLAAVKKSGMFNCSCGASQLFHNWNDDDALNRDLWLANLWGRHGIGTVEAAQQGGGNG